MEANALPMLGYYAKRAAEYEEVYRKPERQADLAALKTHVRRRMAGADVLEMACGTGYWTEVMAPACRSILATDASDEVLAVARSKTYGGATVRFERADAYTLDGVSGSFTAGFAGFWWSHVPKDRLPAFLDAFHDHLASGARVCFLDNRYVEGSSTPIAFADAQGNTYQERRLRDGSTHVVLKNFPTAAELRAAVAGRASAVEVVEFAYYWCMSYRKP